MRLLASFDNYLATNDEHGLQIHHFASADITCTLSDGKNVGLSMETSYPWQGTIRLTITGTDKSLWRLSIRLPEWSRESILRVNGQVVLDPIVEKGYVILEQIWQLSDVIEVDLALKPTLIASNPRIDATRASLAIQQGPLVYCIEACDQDIQGSLLDVAIDKDGQFKTIWREDLLGGVNVIETNGKLVNAAPWHGKLYQPIVAAEDLEKKSVRLVAIPYFAWGNRGIGPMRVWIPMA
jgi:DUF1680 family protein